MNLRLTDIADAHRWARAGHVLLLLILSTLAVIHFSEIAWGRFITAFVLIDLVGYYPGAMAFRRAAGVPVAPIYHHLYNFSHDYLVAAAGVAVWAMATGVPEWAMLAVPIHLSGDRGLFGNFSKPVSQPFKPQRESRQMEIP